MLKFAVSALAAAAVFAAPALADSLSATQSVERMVATQTDDGSVKVEYLPAEEVVPGETLVYWLAYDNGAEKAAENVVLTVPVPEQVTYIENSATTGAAAVAFSIDGGKSFSPRGELKVTVDGQKREAISEEITHVRWTFTTPIAAGDAGKLGFQAVLN